MFWIFKKKSILIFAICFIFVLCVSLTYFMVVKTSTPLLQKVVVIDAGHGGIDNGSIGYSGSYESELNLSYAKTLKKYCEDFGYKVVMTRENTNGLYSAFAKNKKKDDMLKRKEIIEKARPDIVISIHMNSYSEESCHGAQVFYNKSNDLGKSLADNIQKQFVQNLYESRSSAEAGDYYMVNCTQFPSVIVECGFVSNQKEESLLLTEEYRKNVCYSILCGTMTYFSQN